MKKRIISLILIVVFTLSLFGGCNNNQNSPPTQPSNLNALLIVTTLGDKSFNDSAWAGFQKANESYGVDINISELGDKNINLATTIENASNSGLYDIICVSSAQYGIAHDWLTENAQNYPDIKYIYFDAAQDITTTHPNVQYISFNQSQADFLAGAVAALTSETGVISFIGGNRELLVEDFLIGFLSGAKHINPDIKVYIDYVNNWSDVDIAYDIAKKAHENGADVIHAVSGGSSKGAIKYCSENDIKFIGIDSDQYEIFKTDMPEYADIIITSVLKECGIAIYNSIGYIANDVFTHGNVNYNLASYGVGIVKNENYKRYLTETEQVKIENIEKQIINGTIQVPSVYTSTQKLQDLKDDLALKVETDTE